MSARFIVSAFLALGIAGTDIGAAEMARLPSAVGVIAPNEFEVKRGASASLPQDVIEHAIGADGSPLAENGWDFTKPETIPGFGTLPPGYQANRVRPRFSGSD
jgi:hypothetical protein